jgi:RNA polymerase sigma-70 factor (ECF subfamily)
MSLSPPDTRYSLILRLRDVADHAGWDEVLEVYGSLVFRCARRRGLQAADAEDVVQEVFSAVARSVEQWLNQTQRGRFRSWLLGITRNIAINVLTRAPRGGVGNGGDGGLAALTAMPDPDGAISRQFDQEFAWEVYHWAASRVRDSVKPITWEAFHLTHLEGLTVQEVADRLGISVGNVYIARSRVMSRLKEVVRQFEVTE